MKKFFKTVWMVAYPILIVVGITVVVSAAFAIIPMLGKEKMPADIASLLDMSKAVNITLVANIISIPVLLLIVSGDDKRIGKRNHKNKFITYLIYMLLAVVVSVFGNIILNRFGLGADDEGFNQVAEAMNVASPFLMAALAVVIGPVLEEILFRGIVCRRLRKAWGPAWAVIISALLFGLYHGNLTQGVYAAILGAILAIAYVNTDKLWLCMVMHVLGNLAAMMFFT